MKSSELRELSAESLKEKINAWDEELFNLRFQAKMGQLGNPLQLRIIRRDRARAVSIMKQKKRESAKVSKA
jgi:large subunit ribosomal protein L29